MKFFDEIKPLYMETDASSEGVGAILLQTREGTSSHSDDILRMIAFVRACQQWKKDIVAYKENH